MAEFVRYHWSTDGRQHAFDLVRVAGTGGRPYSFGDGGDVQRLEVEDFFIGTTPVTQALWTHVLGTDSNPAIHRGADLPVENVSWDEIIRPAGFLERLNESAVRTAIASQIATGGSFRLSTEAEWEYAARGGRHWRDGYRFSGSNDVDSVAWYDRKHGDHTQPVALKAPNQIGIFDMSGNVWEWCQDTYTPDCARIPKDGSPF